MKVLFVVVLWLAEGVVVVVAMLQFLNETPTLKEALHVCQSKMNEIRLKFLYIKRKLMKHLFEKALE